MENEVKSRRTDIEHNWKMLGRQNDKYCVPQLWLSRAAIEFSNLRVNSFLFLLLVRWINWSFPTQRDLYFDFEFSQNSKTSQLHCSSEQRSRHWLNGVNIFMFDGFGSWEIPHCSSPSPSRRLCLTCRRRHAICLFALRRSSAWTWIRD